MSIRVIGLVQIYRSGLRLLAHQLVDGFLLVLELSLKRGRLFAQNLTLLNREVEPLLGRLPLGLELTLLGLKRTALGGLRLSSQLVQAFLQFDAPPVKLFEFLFGVAILFVRVGFFLLELRQLLPISVERAL